MPLQLTSPSVWYLQLHIGLSLAPVSQVSTHPFTLLSPPTPITTITTTVSTTLQPTSHQTIAPTYVTIGILASVVLVLLLCVGVAVGVACMAKGKASFQEKTSAICREKGLEELNSARRVKNSYKRPPAMTRTSSTTGFPTQERRLKTSRASKKSTPMSSDSLHKSRSLPSILPPHIIGQSITPLAFSCEPAARRAKPRGHTRARVKKLNVDTAERAWAAEQLKVNRGLNDQHVVQDLLLKRKKYGVNEAGQHTQNTGPYARYVVRSLATTAKTPEPGSTPITVL